MGKSVRKHPITAKEMEFAHLVLRGELTDAEAAVQCGFAAGQGPHLKRKPCVMEYMHRYQESVREGLAKHETKKLAKLEITREDILRKHWEFANIDPALTGYNTTSQAKSLESLCEMLGFSGPEGPAKEPLGALPRAAWQDEQERRPN